MKVGFKQFLQNRTVGSVGRVVERGFKDKPLEKQVQAMRGLIAMAAGLPGSSTEKARVNVRANLLKNRGLPADIRGMVKKGKTKEEIKEYYWSCKEFVDLWTVDLAMEEATLDELIRGIID